MLGMGMSLVPDDFARVFKYPKAVLIGLTNQLIFLPIIGFLLAISFGLNATMATGLMILSVCPGGPTSNLITQVCKGNIALSITMTAFASFASMLTIPFILSYALQYFDLGTNIVVKLPIANTILQIMVITVIPISLGMVIRHFKPAFSKRMERPMRIASTVIFVLVFVAIFAVNLDLLGEAIREVGLVTLVLNLVTMSLGFLTARLFQLDLKNSISITIESGIQNGTLAVVVATTIFHSFEMGIPAAIYSIWMFATGGFAMWYFGRRKEQPASDPA